jgi:hypothetical protein
MRRAVQVVKFYVCAVQVEVGVPAGGEGEGWVGVEDALSP